MTVEELERLKAKCTRTHRLTADSQNTRTAWSDEPGAVSLLEILALAIHGLNCQAAGITAERLGDIQMVPVIDMDEVRA